MHKYNNEVVTPELWQWQIIYDDGTSLMQYDEKGAFHRISEIDQNRIKTATLFNIKTGRRISLEFQKGMELIHRYRRKVLNAGTQFETRETSYIWGWRKGAEYMIMHITDDNITIYPFD